MTTLVLGYGEMGRAMECLLKDRVPLAIWEKFPQGGFRSVSLREAARQAEMAIFCLPTAAHTAVLADLVPQLATGCTCLTVAKGLDAAGRPVAEILRAALGERFPYGTLHGPMIAEEILAGRGAFAQLGYRGDEVVGRVTNLFSGTALKVRPTADMLGVNWAVVLKNVYALAFGMADELHLGANVRGWLTVECLRELGAIVRHMGGDAGSAHDLAGLGDLVTTATSEHSHHHGLGRRLARGETTNLAGEAIHTLSVMGRRSGFDESAFPLYRWIHDMVRDPRDALRRFADLMGLIDQNDATHGRGRASPP